MAERQFAATPELVESLLKAMGLRTGGVLSVSVRLERDEAPALVVAYAIPQRIAAALAEEGDRVAGVRPDRSESPT